MADFFENATVAEQAALIRGRLRPDNVSSADSTVSWEQELLQKAGPPAVDEPIPPRDRSLPCPLSPNQQRIWFMEQVIAGAPVYNEAEAVRLRGELNVEVLEKALNVIIARHENFRTTIQTTDDEPSAVVHENWPLRLKQIDLSSLLAGTARGGSRAFADRRATASIRSQDQARNPRHLAPPRTDGACLHSDDASSHLRLVVGRCFVARIVGFISAPVAAVSRLSCLPCQSSTAITRSGSNNC